MKLKLIVFACLALISINSNAKKKCGMEKQAWKLAVQTWSFNHFSFFEAVDKAEKIGFKYLEVYPGQKLGNGLEGTTNYDMPEATQKIILQKLKEKGLKIVNYGVTNPDGEEEWETLFTFANNMGIETIVIEPQFEELDMIEKLCKKHKIHVAIHNHAKSSIYWDPNTVLKNLENRSKWIGACCDNGHWMRSGIQPNQGYETLKGHIRSLHFKDMNEFDDLEAHTVPVGTGKLDVRATLLKLKKLNFKGVITLEYEYNRENPDNDVKQSFEYLNKLSKEIL